MYKLARQIETAYEREVSEARMAVDLSDLPIDYEHLTTEWLTSLICENAHGAKVVEFRAEDADDLNKGHKRIWLDYNRIGVDANLPRSIFCKDSQHLNLRILRSRLIAQEIDFYRNIQPDLGIETPNCLFANYDPDSYNSLLVFEDLMPIGGAFCTEDTEITFARAEMQAVYLASLHARHFGQIKSDPRLKNVRQFSDILDRMNDYYDAGFGAECERGFELAFSVIPGRLFDRANEIWPATEKMFARNRVSQNMLTHGDCHLRNWFLNPRGAMRLGDWEVVSSGDGIFDLTYAVVTSSTVENRRAWEESLLKTYLRELAARGGPQIPFHQAWKNYCAQLFLCLAWWTPCMPTQPDFHFQPKEATLEVIRRVTTAIDDHDALRVLSTL